MSSVRVIVFIEVYVLTSPSSHILFHGHHCGMSGKRVRIVNNLNVIAGSLPRPQSLRSPDHHHCHGFHHNLYWYHHPTNVQSGSNNIEDTRSAVYHPAAG